MDNLSLDGTWATEGYGLMLHIAGDQLECFEITSLSCQPAFTATRLEQSSTTATFAGGDGQKIRISLAGSAGTRWLRFHDAVSRIRLRRAPGLPQTCSQPAPADPLSTFNVFWTTFRELYGFFGLHGVDWQAVYRQFRPQVSPSMPDGDLFQLLTAMIEPLHDAHTFLRGSSPEQAYYGWRSGTDPFREGQRRGEFYALQERYLQETYHTLPLQKGCDGDFGFTLLPGSLGYLRIATFWRYTPDGDYDRGLAALDEALDRFLPQVPADGGLVIDVRLNPGGNDGWATAIAGRLTDTPYLAYRKEARSDPQDASRWSASQRIWVRPRRRRRFHGEVILLTGPNSVSAAETFTMALMGRSPRVVRIGEPTQGVFSDVMGRRLPNGWRFGLPNERYLTQDGIAFDGPGIPPDHFVPVFTPDDLARGRDGALERALEYLS